MKKRFTGKILGILLVTVIILGSTAALSVAMAAAQNAADKEVVVTSTGVTSTSDKTVAENSDTPVPTSMPFTQSDSGPRPNDISWPDASDLAAKEINRVLGVDVSSYESSGSYFSGDEPNRPVWEMVIYNESYKYFVVLDAVTGQIYRLYFNDLTKPPEDLATICGPLPGDSTYNEAATKAMSIIDNKATITNTRFFIDGFTDTQKVFWIDVSLNNGNDYLIGITKEDRTFIGYSFNEGRIDEGLFNQ